MEKTVDVPASCKTCTQTGPGYESPLDAYLNGPQEKIIYVSCLHPPRSSSEEKKKDYLAVVDTDPSSKTYCQVLSRSYATDHGDEFHHFNWNSCSSCYDKPSRKRDKLIVPCLNSSRIYVFDVSNEKEPKLIKVIDNLVKDFKVSAPHTVHCLPNGQVMVSCMGDEEGNAKGSFILIDCTKLEIVSFWSNRSTDFGYDFWYQPRHNIMASSEWGAPKAWRTGLNLDHIQSGHYGQSLHFWNWTTRELLQSIDLGSDGLMPLEIRFLHEPSSGIGFVGCALPSTIYQFDKEDGQEKWSATKVISVPPVKVSGWVLPEVPGTVTDILISMDDQYLYFSNWLQGDVRQYNISNPKCPQLVGQLFLGGLLCEDNTSITVLDDHFERPRRPVVKGRKLLGGPQMLQLSLDGKRLYVTNSLYTSWDNQFYPEMIEKGSTMVKIDVNTKCGGLSLDKDFLVDFGQEPNGPVLAHEMRYPGGDCSSDIWL